MKRAGIVLVLILTITAGRCICLKQVRTSEPIWVSRGYCDWKCDGGDKNRWIDCGEDYDIAFRKAERACMKVGGCYTEMDCYQQ